MFSATVSVSNKREMLEDHADAEPARLGRRRQGHRAPFPFDLAGIGPHDAVGDLHQRALARAVLADEAVYLARSYHEVDAVVGYDGGVALYDSAQREAAVLPRSARRAVFREPPRSSSVHALSRATRFAVVGGQSS